MPYSPTNLGFLPGGSSSQAFGVNTNGSVAVGSAANAAGNKLPVYWDASNVIHSLPMASTGLSQDQASACSSDGSVIVGQTDNGANLPLPARWIGPGFALTQLALLAGTGQGAALCCSSDGTTIYGWCAATTAGALRRPCIWVNGAVTLLPGTVSRAGGAVLGCSPDGSVGVGYTYEVHGGGGSIGSYQATKWVGGAAATATVLPSPAGGVNFFVSPIPAAAAVACSSDGSVIVGTSNTADGSQVLPIYWNPTEHDLTPGDTGSGFVGGDTNCVTAVDGPGNIYTSFVITQSLVSLPGGADTFALAMSGNASTVVGWGHDSLSRVTAIKWVLGSTPPPPTVPPVPTGLACGSNGKTFFTAAWSASSGAVTYTLQYRAVGTTAWTQISGIVGTSQVIIDLPANTTFEWQVAAINGVGSSGFSISANCATQSTGSATFLICNNAWTIAQPLVKIYGLDHLIGQPVVGLADGVPVGPLTVAADGSVTLPFSASLVTLGVGFTVQLQTPYLDTGNPTIQGKRKDVTGATVRVDASAAPSTGTNQPDGGSFTPTQVGPAWTNMQPSVTQDPQQFPATYLSPSGQTVNLLFSGDFRANLQPGWDTRGQIAVQQTLPLPLAITAVIPEILAGDSAEQAIGQNQNQQGDQQQSGPGMWMLNSRGRR